MSGQRLRTSCCRCNAVLLEESFERDWRFARCGCGARSPVPETVRNQRSEPRGMWSARARDQVLAVRPERVRTWRREERGGVVLGVAWRPTQASRRRRAFAIAAGLAAVALLALVLAIRMRGGVELGELVFLGGFAVLTSIVVVPTAIAELIRRHHVDERHIELKVVRTERGWSVRSGAAILQAAGPLRVRVEGERVCIVEGSDVTESHPLPDVEHPEWVADWLDAELQKHTQHEPSSHREARTYRR